ncbi:hypothetical protein B0H16DRAFT_523504 [Mycena metata]|uniref:Secreted protein n=1 Tax=Mycena metata TaxID=1033252 RepID=A0AAD7H8M9_9AGAR|nr:hypothetical protein B0H16DRAFT_523504 [Mycena metata]
MFHRRRLVVSFAVQLQLPTRASPLNAGESECPWGSSFAGNPAKDGVILPSLLNVAASRSKPLDVFQSKIHTRQYVGRENMM